MILGISAFYHDASACLVDKTGTIVAAAQEERFSRKKNDASFPTNAIRFCLDAAGISISELDLVVYYEKPLLKFERLLETWLSFAPKGFSQFMISAPIWAKNKLFLKSTIEKELRAIGGSSRVVFADHHLSHAASAFYPSPFSESAILTIDGVGEWTTTSILHGKENHIESLLEIQFPHSLGFLYSSMTQYLGFKVNSGEYKVMGLAPYGKPLYVNEIKDNLIQFNDDGSFFLNMVFFDFCTSRSMINREKWERLFDSPSRIPDAELTSKNADLAASIQVVIQDAVLNLAKKAKEVTGSNNLCLAGGVALNCVANSHIFKQAIFNRLWVQPAAGDAGGSLGAALLGFNAMQKTSGFLGNSLAQNTSIEKPKIDAMNFAYLGPDFTDQEIEHELRSSGLTFTNLDSDTLISKAAIALSSGKILGWFQGRMEFGPRSLGNRSILADPRRSEMQVDLNMRIKFRETFRPFAPSVLSEHLEDWFEFENHDYYMLFVNYLKQSRRKPSSLEKTKDERFEVTTNYSLRDLLREERSVIPAVTHLDFSARTQVVTKHGNPKFHELISAFHGITGIPMIINTSFNVRGEPIVCTPRNAIDCFLATDIDELYISNFVVRKSEQVKSKKESALRHFDLD